MKRTKQQNQKFNQGITLVALVVTIVVLLILSSVSLNLVLGDNGIIVKAKEAAETTAAAQEKEAMERNLLEKELENSLSTPAVEPTDGVKIPTGFYYVGGTKASGIVISDNKNDKYNFCILKINSISATGDMITSYYKVYVLFSLSIPVFLDFTKFYVSGES